MHVLLWVIVPVVLIVALSGFFVRRSGAITLALPIVIVTIGSLWMYGALAHYRRATGQELNGLVGYHYSVPEWGFKYAPNGRQIERWSFHVPSAATFVLLLVSAVVASAKQWRKIGVWRALGLWLYHFGCAAAFLIVYGVLWMEAASVFI